MSQPFPHGRPGWADAFLGALPIEHVAIATLAAPFDTEVVAASDDAAVRSLQAQLDLGEGPCWQAASTRLIVRVPDLSGDDETAWPLAREALRDLGASSVYAVPLTVGELDVGVVDLSSPRPHALSDADIARAGALARAASAEILRHTLDHGLHFADVDLSSRRVVHQATGMVIAQTGIAPPEALLMIRARAFATDRPVAEVATDIVERRFVMRL